jgi:hypothetical protein
MERSLPDIEDASGRVLLDIMPCLSVKKDAHQVNMIEKINPSHFLYLASLLSLR